MRERCAAVFYALQERLALVLPWLHACGDADRAAGVPVPRGACKMTWGSS
jgi:hypothetical protein